MVNTHWLPPVQDPKLWYKTRRFKIFSVAFLVCILVALSYVFSRPAVYLSYATLLTVAKTAIDVPSNDADIQHVAIQKQILLGAELLAETSRRLKAGESHNVSLDLSPAVIRQKLDVKPVAETNLVEMTAAGSKPEILPLVINTWIDVYLDARAKEVSQLLGDTTQILRNELDALLSQINNKRMELDQFRRNNDISSLEREENDALARLKGLNNSLNVANEEAIKAKARLDAIKKAIVRGQAVVPQEDTRTLSQLENRAQQLREEVADLNRRYTQEYLNLSPTLRVIPEQLATLEDEIRRMRQSGQTIVQSDAEQEYAAAQQAAHEIRQQLDGHKSKATEFSTRFMEHEALRSELEGLESLYRETQERLTQVEARYSGKYPQVDVIARAFLPTEPVGPNYWLDALIALAGSIGFGLFCVWLSEFLMRKDHPDSTDNFSIMPVYAHDMFPPVQRNLSSPLNVLPQQQASLKKVQHRELTVELIAKLFASAGDKEKLLIALLLSGPSLEEIAVINSEDIDSENEQLIIGGVSHRAIPLNPVLKSLLANPANLMVDPSGEPLSVEDINALLACAVSDAGLPGAEAITAETLRQTYIIYLVRQGLRLSELYVIMGYIPPAELSSYGIYSPPEQKQSIHTVNRIYPGLQNSSICS